MKQYVRDINTMIAVDLPTQVKHTAPANLLFSIYAFIKLRKTLAVLRVPVWQVRTAYSPQVSALAGIVYVPLVLVGNSGKETKYAVVGIVVIS